MSAPAEEAIPGWLDVVRNVRSGSDVLHPVSVAGPEDSLVLEGWCAPHHAAECVLAVVDGTRSIPLARGRERPDLVALFGEAGLHAGYRGVLPMRVVGPGEHVLEIDARAAGGATVALGSTQLRVVGPEPSVPRSEHVAIDKLAPAQMRLPFGMLAQVTGWAVDVENARPAEQVVVIVNDRWIVQARCGLPRPEDAGAAGVADAGIGFEALIATEQIGPGPVRVRAAAFAGGRRFDGFAEARFVVEEIPG